jgi:hypothetical protein
VPQPERFAILATLPDAGRLRRALALDRSGPPRAVVLAFPPAARAEDPAVLAALSRDAEAAARVHHPCVIPTLGLEAAGDSVALVEPYRAAVTLRELVDAGGRLPPGVALRAGLDASAGLAALHAVDPGDGRPLCHGALGLERLLVLEDGTVAVAGLGAAAASGGPDPDPAADVRALGLALHECLAGEPAAAPPVRLDAPGVSAALAAAVDRALGVPGTEPFASAAALGEALAAAGEAAPRTAVAAYADAILPPGEGARAALGRLVAGALPPPIPPREDTEPTAEVTAELLDPSRTPAPVGSPPSGSEPPLRSIRGAPAHVEPTPPAAPQPPPPAPPLRSIPVIPAVVEPTPLAVPAPDAAVTFARPGPPPRPSRTPMRVALVCALFGFAAGVTMSRLRTLPDADAAPPPPAEAAPAIPTPTPVPTSTEAAPPKLKATPKPAPAVKPRTRPAAPTSKPSATGILSVVAPLDADVLLDGKAIGKGIVRKEIPAGDHRIEVRYEGQKVSERFRVERGETWTYEVTPAGN